MIIPSECKREHAKPKPCPRLAGCWQVSGEPCKDRASGERRFPRGLSKHPEIGDRGTSWATRFCAVLNLMAWCVSHLGLQIGEKFHHPKSAVLNGFSVLREVPLLALNSLLGGCITASQLIIRRGSKHLFPTHLLGDICYSVAISRKRP